VCFVERYGVDGVDEVAESTGLAVEV